MPCGPVNLTVNGLYLSPDPGADGDDFAGSGNVTEHSGLEPRSLGFSWTSSCLLGDLPATDTTGSVAQLVTLQIDNVDELKLEDPVGFRLSYRNFPAPQLLRLSALLNDTDDSESHDSWRDPPAHLRIDISQLVDNLDAQADSTQHQRIIEHEIEGLKNLQAHAKELHKIIRTKEKFISQYLGKDVFSFSESVGHCDSFGCVLDTLVRKANGAIKIMSVRLRQSHGQALASGTHVTDVHRNETRSPDAPFTDDSEREDSKPRLSQGVIVALGAIVAVLGCGCVFAALRGCFCSPRRKVERLADREERQRARAYKKITHRRQWRDWWHRRDSRIIDYEDKRALIIEQEGLLEEAMQEEIRQLQTAHEVVDGIVRAHNDQGHSQTTSNTRQAGLHISRRSSNASDGFSQPLSRTSSLPSYTTEPRSEGLPGYYEHGEEVRTVADGFAEYTPSSSLDDHWSPVSSIINVSPRQSTETMRTKYEEQEEGERYECDDDDQNNGHAES